MTEWNEGDLNLRAHLENQKVDDLCRGWSGTGQERLNLARSGLYLFNELG